MRKLVFNIILLLTVAFIINSCDSPNLVDNPKPFVEFVTAPIPGETLSVDHTFIQWRGNNSDYKFTYKLSILNATGLYDPYMKDSVLSDNEEVYFKNLDEGSYQMEVTGYSFGVQSTISRLFKVKAITQPALGFFRKYAISNKGDTVSIYITMNNIDSIAAIKMDINYNKNIVSLINIEDGPFITNNRFTQIILPNGLTVKNSKDVLNANNLGRVEIDTGFLTSLAANYSNSISGTGKIIKLNFYCKKVGQTNLEFSSVTLYNPKGEKISNDTDELGTIVVQK